MLALQLLYQVDLTGDSLEDSMASLWGVDDLPADVRAFAEGLARGVRENLEEIDRLIQTSSEHWRIERMPLVDRNILRLAVFELLHRPEIPERVTLNEAIELGKRFSTEDSGAFINGVLDQIRASVLPAEARESS
jgi:N utilization substance protein B